jgi:hypothetical protein
VQAWMVQLKAGLCRPRCAQHFTTTRTRFGERTAMTDRIEGLNRGNDVNQRPFFNEALVRTIKAQ